MVGYIRGDVDCWARLMARSISASGGRAGDIVQMAGYDWPLWEVSVRAKAGLDHKHCGSLHASDAALAVQLVRKV